MERPEFLGEPRERKYVKSHNVYHEYSMPEDVEEIMEAIQWMKTAYNDVDCDRGMSYGMDYCNLVGTVRQ